MFLSVMGAIFCGLLMIVFIVAICSFIKSAFRARRVMNAIVAATGTHPGKWEWFKAWVAEIFSDYYATITINGVVINYNGDVVPARIPG
jgi:hypothetical protein